MARCEHSGFGCCLAGVCCSLPLRCLSYCGVPDVRGKWVSAIMENFHYPLLSQQPLLVSPISAKRA
eukprot:1143664-Pelagomonas_calceolata.AAC.8